MPYTFESTIPANGCYFIVRTCYCILLNSLRKHYRIVKDCPYLGGSYIGTFLYMSTYISLFQKFRLNIKVIDR